ncbi:3D domain-containing protein [Zunongwangia sp. HGR-M22]|uniref:3D domain-containing protein n=1 Tax=Zunongwangia sp. HGR-M22 TaxID=3015168 RepID=UPI0022DE2AA9|nr:hypothetical protein [Zunongwangia sp. HGR-M22]WBL24093.1 hypothetical protein PBT91_09105 [Zunongwangia sp. HGR-M22]
MNSISISIKTCCQFLFLSLGLFACNSSDKKVTDKSTENWDTIKVTVSAFNSVQYQTAGSNPNLAAWGDTLKPGMNAVAISRDLIGLGINHNDEIKIAGLDSIFVVKDKMHYRWKKRVDIYMGNDIERAKNFGKKKLEIYYKKPEDSTKAEVASE